MASKNADVLANRDAPIPVVQVHPADDDTPAASESRTPNTETGSSHHLHMSKLKDKLESIGLDNMSRESTSRMGDKMINL